MLRCASWRTCCRALWRVQRNNSLSSASVPLRRRIASAYSTNNEDFTFERTSRPSNRYEAFKRLPFPEGAEKQDPAAWATLLEAGLPPHLRIRPESATYVISGVEDIAEILLAAQRLVQPKNGIDLLCYLGVEKGGGARWSG